MVVFRSRKLATIKVAVLLGVMGALLFAYSGGPPAAHTGGFGEDTCIVCHLNGPAGGSFAIVGVPEQYTPGEVYPIGVVISQPLQSRWGFELAARFQADGTQAGSLEITDDTTQIVPFGGIQYIEHTSLGTRAGIPDGPVSWTFNWRAPAEALGPVQFNAAGNAANNDRTPDGDFIYTAVVVSNPIQQQPGGLTCLDATVTTGDFGESTSFVIEDVNHIAERRDWISINNGPPQIVGLPDFAVDTSLAVDNTTCATDGFSTAYSAVTRAEGDLFIEYSHNLTKAAMGDGVATWSTDITLTNLSDQEMQICYYPYLNPDVMGTPDDDEAVNMTADPDFGGLSIRVTDPKGPVFVYADLSDPAADGWELSLSPQTRDTLSGADSCIDLAGGASSLTGNVEAAWRYSRTIPPGESVTLSIAMGRVQ